MHGLQNQFGDHIDFIYLNIDLPATLPLRERFNIVQRTSYVLIDSAGNILQRWYGPLDETVMAEYLTSFVAA